MPNFIDDDTALPDTKVDRRSVPPGESETRFWRAADANAVFSALEDIRDNIQGGPNGAELRITPEGPWYGTAGENLPAGVVSDYSAHPHLQSRTILCVKGADNQGTILTGIDATGISTGDFRILLDVQATGQQDSGTIVLKHEDGLSLAANRFTCPGQVDYISPPNGVTLLIYGEDLRWHVFGVNGRTSKSITQSLQIYPKMLVGQATPISGTYNNYDPTGWTGLGGYGVAGSDAAFKNHTMVEFVTDAGGATITGFDVQSLQADPAYYGALKVISNRGTGTLTLSCDSGGSDAENRIHTPNSEDVVLQAGEAAWAFYGYYDPDTTQPGWRVVALSQNRSTFTSITVTSRVAEHQVTLTSKDSPSQLSIHTSQTNDWSPGGGVVAGANTHNSGSIITGMVPTQPLVKGELKYILNVGTGPLAIFNQNSSSSSDNRFTMPNGRPVVLPTRCSMGFRYDESGNWNALDSRDAEVPASVSIKPAELTASANTNNYSPTDASTGWPGRLAKVWRISGSFASVLTGIEESPTGLPSFIHGDRIQLINYGSAFVIAHQSAQSSVLNRITCPPGGADNPNYILLNGASVWLYRDGIGGGWIIEGARI